MENISNIIALPPIGIASTLFTTFQTFLILTQYQHEIKTPTAYSKFAIEEKEQDNMKISLSPRIAQTLVYGLNAAICSAYFLFRWKYYNNKNHQKMFSIANFKDFVYGQKIGQFQLIAPHWMIIIHFLKRVFEANFVHKSKPNVKAGSLSMSLTAAALYALQTFVPLVYQSKLSHNYYQDSIISLKIGLSMYTMGELGNLYHHWILKKLRDVSSKTDVNIVTDESGQYKIPQYGLFRYVWCPHYLTELLSFFSFAVITNHLNFYLMALASTSYLVGRATSTKKWYQKTFKEKCPERKAIFPFIY